jgi:hypothetical protein
MLVDTVNIENKVLDTLKNDATLSGYVKSFTKGDINASRILFPFVALGNMRYREGRLLDAGGMQLAEPALHGASPNSDNSKRLL